MTNAAPPDIHGDFACKECVAPAERAAVHSSLLAPDRELARWYHWGWPTFAAACAVVVVAVLAVFELVLASTGREQPAAAERVLDLARGTLTGGVLAGVFAWFLLMTRRRLEGAREELRLEAERLEEQMQHLERAAGLAAVLRMMGHEIRNPLHSMTLHLKLLERAAAALPPDTGRDVADATSFLKVEVERLRRLIDEYLTHGRASSVTVRIDDVDVDALVRRAVALHREAFAEARVEIDTEIDAPLPRVRGDGEKLEKLLYSLLRNALEATRDRGGRVVVSVTREAERIAFAVRDNGPGFVDVAAAFRPLYSTKPGRTGLGLAIVRDIARAHHGTVCARNLDHGGAQVEVQLPLAEAA